MEVQDWKKKDIKVGTGAQVAKLHASAEGNSVHI